jgi:hypothetical protein
VTAPGRAVEAGRSPAGREPQGADTRRSSAGRTPEGDRPRRLRLRALSGALALAGGLLAAGCDDLSYRDIGRDINVLTKRNDALVPPARDRLVAQGRRALPQIETALHTASVDGRLQLLDALDRIGDPEGVPVLRHFALHDPDPRVRAACRGTLERWAAAADGRAPSARAALERVAAGTGG